MPNDELEPQEQDVLPDDSFETEGDIPAEDSADLSLEDEPQDLEDDQTPPAQQRSRAQDRIRQLVEEVHNLRRKVEETSRPVPQQPPAPDLSSFSPEERQAYENQQLRNQLNGAIGYMADQIDALKFETLKSRDPVVAKMADRVEETFRNARQRGLAISREEALQFVLGQEVLKRKTVSSGRKATSRPAQPTKGVSGKSRASSVEKEDADFEERMKSYTF